MNTDEELAFLNALARHAGITQGSSIWTHSGLTSTNPPQSFFSASPELFESEGLRRRTARDEAKNVVRKPSRGASLERALREIKARSTGRDDPAVRLAAIEALADMAIELHGSEIVPNDAADSLEWRRACDEAYTDGIVGRKCGLGPAEHGLGMDSERSQALAQAFALGWSVADEAAAYEDVVEAARHVLKFGDAESRDALRDALEQLPGAREGG